MSQITGIRKATNSTTGVEFFSAIIQDAAPKLRISANGLQRLEIPTGSIPLAGVTNEEVAKSLIGTQLPGQLVYTEVDEFTFTAADGSEVTANHRWVYTEGQTTVQPATPKKAVVSDEVVEPLTS
jgi:hypothetical protein